MKGLVLSEVEGFTLIELLVVVALIGSLTVVLLPRFGQYRDYQALLNGAAQLQSALRTAQSNAVSGVGCDTIVSASAWDLKFSDDGKSYVIEPQCANPLVVSPTPSPTPPSKSYQLPAGVSIVCVNYQNETSCDEALIGTAAVGFTAITGKAIFLTPGYTSSYPLVITLQVDNSSEKKQVVVEKGGAIYVKSS